MVMKKKLCIFKFSLLVWFVHMKQNNILKGIKNQVGICFAKKVNRDILKIQLKEIQVSQSRKSVTEVSIGVQSVIFLLKIIIMC